MLVSLKNPPEVPLSRTLNPDAQALRKGAFPHFGVSISGPAKPLAANHKGVLMKVFPPCWLAALFGVTRNYVVMLQTKQVFPRGLIVLPESAQKGSWLGKDRRFYTTAELKAYFLLYLHYGERKAFKDKGFQEACWTVQRRLRKALDLGPLEEIKLTPEMVKTAQRNYTARWDVNIKRYLDRQVWEILNNENDHESLPEHNAAAHKGPWRDFILEALGREVKLPDTQGLWSLRYRNYVDRDVKTIAKLQLRRSQVWTESRRKHGAQP